MERAGPEAQPDGDAYNFVIALCAINRRIPAALRHMQSMHEKGFAPSKATYNEVLLGCARLHRSQTAVTVMKQMEVEAHKYRCCM
jgi:pentatricopeptide repeat protein